MESRLIFSRFVDVGYVPIHKVFGLQSLDMVLLLLDSWNKPMSIVQARVSPRFEVVDISLR